MMIFSLLIIVLWLIHGIQIRRSCKDKRVPILLYYLAISVIVISQIGWIVALKM